MVCVIGAATVNGMVVPPGISVNPDPEVVLCCHCTEPYPLAPVTFNVGVPPVTQKEFGLALIAPVIRIFLLRVSGGIASLAGNTSPTTVVKALNVYMPVAVISSGADIGTSSVALDASVPVFTIAVSVATAAPVTLVVTVTGLVAKLIVAELLLRIRIVTISLFV